MPGYSFKQYRRKQIAELRPYIEGEDVSHVSISPEDRKAGSPKPGDMIARNPKNHADQWLVARDYFLDNFEPLTAEQAEPALATRSGVVKPLDEDDYQEIIRAAAINMRKAPGIRGHMITVQDCLDWWVMKETERRILSALETAEPATDVDAIRDKALEEAAEIASVLAGVGYAGLWAEEIMSALSKAGYRILAPGEVDTETLERAAQVAESTPAYGFTIMSKEDVDAIRTALEEAKENIAHWGSYASKYFQEKHGLEADIASVEAAIRKLKSKDR